MAWSYYPKFVNTEKNREKSVQSQTGLKKRLVLLTVVLLNGDHCTSDIHGLTGIQRRTRININGDCTQKYSSLNTLNKLLKYQLKKLSNNVVYFIML